MAKRKTPQEKLETLTAKRDQLNAQIQREKSRARIAARKEDTRRKIIAGAIALEHCLHEPEFADYFERLLRRHVKPDDKKLFDLA